MLFFCVVGHFVGIYNKFIKKVSVKWFINKLKNINGASKLDVDVSDGWSLDAGVSASMLGNIRKELDIYHYAYDVSRKCLFKFVSKNIYPQTV